MAPDVELKLQNGKTTRLSSLRGKTVALYFYPKDETPGCTVEAQGLRDRWQDLQAAGVVVFGISTQDAASHEHFIDKEKLPFDLVVDADGAIAKALQVPLKNGMSARQTFLVDAQGRLKKVWRAVDPEHHAEEILAAAK
jgi:peroxiredoxin Q/BCP